MGGAVPAYNRGRPYEQRQGGPPLARIPDGWQTRCIPKCWKNNENPRLYRRTHSPLCKGIRASKGKVCHCWVLVGL